MAEEITVEAFFDVLGQSDLVSDAQLLSLTAEFLGGGAKPENAGKVADELVKREILTTWQAENLLQGKHRGFRLGAYRILKPLGQGGMSKVFLAEHEMMRRRSAIKILPAKCQEDADLLNRFHLEARAVAALDHPNIVRAYDFNKDVRYGKEIHYLVMEYVEGSDLRRMVEEQGPLDYRTAAEFICQAAEGLAHAHAAGFVHRDIKPANLLVDPHGVLKVLDLGLATFAFEAEQTLDSTETGQTAVGTADYVAPEQVIDSRNVDGRADIYSLGLTFYFLLTGHRPFSKPTIMELLMAHRTEEPEPIFKLRPDVPANLEAIVDKMIAKSVDQRFQTAKEVAEKLRSWLRDSGSARTYSRISALMAEASRAKQPSGQEATPAGWGGTNTDLELAAVDDAPTRTQDPLGAKSNGGKAVATAELIPVDAKDKNLASVAKPNDAAGPTTQSQHPGGVPQGKPRSPASVSGGTFTNAKDKVALPPEPQNVLLSGLLNDEFMSTLPSDEALAPLADGQFPLASSHATWQRKLDQLMKSPWALAGLGGLMIVVLLLVLLIVSLSWSTPEPAHRDARDSANAKRDVPPSQPTLPAQPTPSTKVAEAPPSAAPPSPPTLPKNAPVSSLPDTTTASEAITRQTPAPAATLPTPKVEAKTPSMAEEGVPSQAETTQPSPPATSAVKEPESAKPEIQKEVSPEELLAALKTITFHVQSADSDPKNALGQTILFQAKRVAGRMNLEVEETGTTVMQIEVKAAGASGVTMTAKLTSPGPNRKAVVLWEKSKPIFPTDPSKVHSRAVLLRVLRENINKFFDDFADDLRRARAKTGVNAAPITGIDQPAGHRKSAIVSVSKN